MMPIAHRFRFFTVAATAALLGACAAVPQTVTHLNSGKVWPDGLPFSEAVRVGDTVYLSGQLGTVPGKLTLAPGGMPAEARQVMDNIKASLQAQGLDMSNIVKCTVMLADMKEWGAFNEIYKTYFSPGRYPARSAFGVSGIGANGRVEVECMAVVPR